MKRTFQISMFLALVVSAQFALAAANKAATTSPFVTELTSEDDPNNARIGLEETIKLPNGEAITGEQAANGQVCIDCQRLETSNILSAETNPNVGAAAVKSATGNGQSQ